MEIVVHSKKSLFEQKFQEKLHHFNRNSQLCSVMQVMIQLDIRSRTKKSDSDPPKKLRLHNPVVLTQQVSNECVIKWMLSQTNESQTGRSQMSAH